MEKKPNILICEDDEDTLELLSIVLGTQYYLHTETNIDERIVDYVCGIMPDLVLMDYLIPQIGGVQAVLNLKADDRTKNIPVLMFSASNMIKKHSRESKADGYISKPFKLDELRKSIQDLLDRRV